MKNLIWYNELVSRLTGQKKDIPVTLKVTEAQRDKFESISETQDRPLGYVMRELALRGLALYERDGKLRDADPEVRPKPNRIEKAHVVREEDLPGVGGRKRVA